jgi:hypothetical protein
MLSLHFLPFYIRHLRFCEFLCATIFKWDENLQQFVKIRTKWRICYFQAQNLLHVIHIMVMFSKLVFDKGPSAKKFQGLAFLFTYCITFICRMDWKLEDFSMQLSNSFLSFEKTIPAGIKQIFIIL